MPVQLYSTVQYYSTRTTTVAAAPGRRVLLLQPAMRQPACCPPTVEIRSYSRTALIKITLSCFHHHALVGLLYAALTQPMLY
eukprot:SAG25_NODE_1393_length_3141_cov_10.875082_2_plen_82_part_00